MRNLGSSIPKRVQRLIRQFNIPLFEQYASGDVLYQNIHQQKPKGIKGIDNLQLFRILGGSKSLIFALQSTLDQNNIHLNHITTNIKKKENTQQLSATHKGIE
jgi:monoamine oxidase